MLYIHVDPSSVGATCSFEDLNKNVGVIMQELMTSLTLFKNLNKVH